MSVFIYEPVFVERN